MRADAWFCLLFLKRTERTCSLFCVDTSENEFLKVRQELGQIYDRVNNDKHRYNSKDDTLDKLRQQRTKTAYWKGVNTLAKKTPNNAKDTFEEKSWINDIEENMDRVVNPTKWKKQDGAYDVDKYKVLQRQRDRYP